MAARKSSSKGRGKASKSSKSSAKGAARGAGRRGRAAGSKKTKSSRADIRGTIHDFTLRAVRDGDVTLRDLPAFARDVVTDAAAGLNRAMPQSSRSVLRQVVEGLTDATAAAASSTKAALSSTAARGSEFVRKDAARAVRDLRSLEGDFVSALSRAGRSLKGAAKEEMESIVQQARRAGTRIRPAAQKTAEAIDGRLARLGTESAATGVRAARSALGGVLGGASGFLQALGEAASGTGPRSTGRRSR